VSNIVYNIAMSQASSGSPQPLVTTKAELREVIRDMLRMHREAGVPEDGLAEILAQWTVAHLNAGTKVTG
jgi:hypothetical protein